MKKCKIDKHIELGLYHQPIINFQGPKSKGASRGMYVKILFVVYNDGKIQLQQQLLHSYHTFFRSTLFSFNLATFFYPGTTFNFLNFQRIVNNNNHLSVLFGPWVSSVKDKNFQCTSVFYQVVLKNVVPVLQYIWASSILWEPVLKRILFTLY